MSYSRPIARQWLAGCGWQLCGRLNGHNKLPGADAARLLDGRAGSNAPPADNSYPVGKLSEARGWMTVECERGFSVSLGQIVEGELKTRRRWGFDVEVPGHSGTRFSIDFIDLLDPDTCTVGDRIVAVVGARYGGTPARPSRTARVSCRPEHFLRASALRVAS